MDLMAAQKQPLRVVLVDERQLMVDPEALAVAKGVALAHKVAIVEGVGG